jgi:hypothetical protein
MAPSETRSHVRRASPSLAATWAAAPASRLPPPPLVLYKCEPGTAPPSLPGTETGRQQAFIAERRTAAPEIDGGAARGPFPSEQSAWEMGRQPCCDKVGVKKGPWTAEEDQKLVGFLLTHGHCCWRVVPKLAGENFPAPCMHAMRCV